MQRRWLGMTLAVLLILSQFAGRSAGAPVPFQQYTTDRYRFNYTEPYRQDIPQVIEWLDEAAAINERVLGRRFEGTIQVDLLPSGELFGRYEGDMVSDPRSGMIAMITPSGVHDRSVLERFPKILTHEMTHVIFGQMRPDPLTTPPWLLEGLPEYVATYGSGQPAFVAMAKPYEEDLRRAALRGELSGIAVGNVYFRGPQVIRFQYEIFGPEKMTRLIETNTGDIQADIKSVLGVAWGDLHTAWLRWVSAETRVPLSVITGDPEAGGIAEPEHAARTVDLLTFRPLSAFTLPKSGPVVMEIGSLTYRAGAETRQAEAAPFLRDGVPMVPLSALTDALGARAGWDNGNRSVTISLVGDLPKPGIWTGTGDAGQYIVVDESYVNDANGHHPTLMVQAGAHEPVAPDLLALEVDGPRLAFAQREFLATPDEAHRQGFDYEAVTIAYI